MILDGRSPFIRELKKIGRKNGCFIEGDGWYISKSVYKGYMLSVDFNLQSRQEMGLHEAANEAAVKILASHGIEARMKSYID